MVVSWGSRGYCSLAPIFPPGRCLLHGSGPSSCLYSPKYLKRLAIRLGLTHHRCMNAYSEDLRKKVVEAKECGMPTVEVARTFGMGISSVKRYAKTAREGGSLRPKKKSP